MKARLITSFKDLPENLQKQYSGLEDTLDHFSLPFKVSEEYLKKISTIGGPLSLQVFPGIEEHNIALDESDDPLSEKDFSVCPGVIHRYKNRILILVTDNCDMNCRHCFRRFYTGTGYGRISKKNITIALDYVKKNRDIHEVIFSGGDPLTLPLTQLKEIISPFLQISRPLLFRISTRIPIVSPSRINSKLLQYLKSIPSLWLVMQVNHNNELFGLSEEVITHIKETGIPMLSQTVLLKNINDDSTVLKNLFTKLSYLGVKPYYLFQMDLAKGTSHFRVPLLKGVKLMKQLRNELSGLSLPVYAVDLPRGGGKIPLTESYFMGTEGDQLLFENLDGEKFSYPANNKIS